MANNKKSASTIDAVTTQACELDKSLTAPLRSASHVVDSGIRDMEDVLVTDLLEEADEDGLTIYAVASDNPDEVAYRITVEPLGLTEDSVSFAADTLRRCTLTPIAASPDTITFMGKTVPKRPNNDKQYDLKIAGGKRVIVHYLQESGSWYAMYRVKSSEVARATGVDPQQAADSLAANVQTLASLVAG